MIQANGARRLGALPAFVATLALLGCATEAPTGNTQDDGELQVVRVGTVPLALFAPLFIADEKGYFADEGIEVEIQSVTSGQDAIPLAATGRLDVVIAGFSAGMFNAIAAGLDVDVVGSMAVTGDDEDEPPAALVVRSDLAADVSDVADLEGRKVAILGGAGGASAYYVALMLEDAGLSLSDVVVEPIANSDMPAALASGAVDAAFASVPANSRAIADGTASTLAVPEAGLSATGIINGGEFSESDLAEPFFTALARGAADLQDGGAETEENLAIIAEATGQEPETLRDTPLFEWLPDLAPLPDQLERMEAIWDGVDALNYDEPLDPASYIDTSFADAID